MAQAESPKEALPADGFFDLVPASELRLYNLRRAGSASGTMLPVGGAPSSRTQPPPPSPTQQPSLASELADMVDISTDMATDVARDLQKKANRAMDLQGRRALWEFWLFLWRSWVEATEFRQRWAEALWPRGGGPKVAKRLERSLALSDDFAMADTRGEDRDGEAREDLRRGER